MSISRSIISRAVEAVILFLQADDDYSALLGSRIYRQPYAGKDSSVTMNTAPRQAHIYAGASGMKPGVGQLWDQVFEVVIEYYSPTQELPVAIGGTGVDDEIRTLAARLYRGSVAAPGPTGRFQDPDYPGQMITLDVRGVLISMPKSIEGESAIRRDITITFLTQESPEGKRPYEA